jgi:hypothetical protein
LDCFEDSSCEFDLECNPIYIDSVESNLVNKSSHTSEIKKSPKKVTKTDLERAQQKTSLIQAKQVEDT